MNLDQPDEPRPRVLVTGARGNIGSRVTPILEKTMDLRLTDLSPTDEDSRYMAGDLTDFSHVYRLMEGMDAVIHLAMAPMRSREPSPGTADPSEELAIAVNMGGTYHVLEAARQRGIKRVVYASSLTIHLGNKHRPCYDSGTPVEPTNFYACTKLFGEQLARVYWRKHGLSTICLRIGQPFPIGNAVYDNLWRDNRRARSNFVEISDVARGLACGITTGVPFGVFNLVSASDNQRFDLTEAGQIGYVPRAFLGDDRLEFFDDGQFPDSPGPVVTHNPDEIA